MQWMDKALKLAPSRVDLRRAFIRQLIDDQRYTEAVQQYALFSAAAPGNVDVLREWGRTVLKDTSLTEEARANGGDAHLEPDRRRPAGRCAHRRAGGRSVPAGEAERRGDRAV